MIEVNTLTLLAVLISFAGLIGVMNWRANQAQSSIVNRISALSVLLEEKETESTKDLHAHLEKVYAEINVLRKELYKFQNTVASDYLKRVHLEQELKKLEGHIVIEIQKALADMAKG